MSFEVAVNDAVGSSGRCSRCGAPLAPGELACPKCFALVNADALADIAARARAAEARVDLAAAEALWRSSLSLLPVSAKQADWVRAHIAELNAQRIAPRAPDAHGRRWKRYLGPLAPIALLAAKAKTFLLLIFKLKFIFSLIAFAGLYWSLYGMRFGIGFAALILCHELGHYVDVRRRGLKAELPLFLPGLGAFVRYEAANVTAAAIAEISLAGPFAGLLSSAACALIWWHSGERVWAALAYTGAFLNVLNLIPVWILDGKKALDPLSQMMRWMLLAIAALLWIIAHNAVFLIVAVGIAFRIFMDRKIESSTAVYDGGSALPLNSSVPVPTTVGTHEVSAAFAYFATLLVLFALLMAAVPAS